MSSGLEGSVMLIYLSYKYISKYIMRK
jgi:hypothetical protein